jgi:Glycosyl hydrolases family 43
MTRATSIQISNTEPRRDTEGRSVDAHDGCLERFEGRYFLYGTAYGATTGFTAANEYRCYSSADLRSWTAHGPLLPDRPAGVYYRPRVAYCARSRLYLLWYNWYPVLWEGQYGVAVSERPEGPFRIVHAHVPVGHRLPGDHGLFVDDDGTAYLIYTSIAGGHSISIERLAPDYLSSTGASSGVLSAGDEAPALFKRQGIYYALFDSCCCFCPPGSGAKVYSATAPLGPYTYANNINRTPTGAVIVGAQQTQIARLETTAGPAYIWMGDRWGSAPDGRKGHDFQFWSAPLQFGQDGVIAPLAWVDSWQLQIEQA